MAWRTAGNVGRGGGPLILFFPPCCFKPAILEESVGDQAAAGNPNITDQLLKGVQLGDRTYKNHLDGYNHMDLLIGKGPSKRQELFYFGGAQLGAVRLDNFKFTF
jgi:hypothetical protein